MTNFKHRLVGKLLPVIIVIIVSAVLTVVLYNLSQGDKSNAISNIANNLHLIDWDWVAIIIALLSFIVAAMTLHSQNETKKNTSIMSSRELHDNLLRYFDYLIRNIVKLCSLQIKLDNANWNSYPSEEYLWKMKLIELDENNTSIKLLYGDEYHKLQSFNELIRSFNYSIDATIIHLKDITLDKDLRIRDIVNLEAMIWYTSKHLSDIMNYFFGGECRTKIKRFIMTFIIQFRQDNYAKIDLDNPKAYYQAINESPFIKEIFNDDEDSKNFFIDNLLFIISCHLSKMKNGYDEIPLITL